MREKILTFIEKNSRIDLKELAIVLGVDETTVMNELEKMEEEHIICGYHTLIDWDKAGIEKVTALIEVLRDAAAWALTRWQSGSTTIRRSIPFTSSPEALILW